MSLPVSISQFPTTLAPAHNLSSQEAKVLRPLYNQSQNYFLLNISNSPLSPLLQDSLESGDRGTPWEKPRTERQICLFVTAFSLSCRKMHPKCSPTQTHLSLLQSLTQTLLHHCSSPKVFLYLLILSSLQPLGPLQV